MQHTAKNKFVIRAIELKYSSELPCANILNHESLSL